MIYSANRNPLIAAIFFLTLMIAVLGYSYNSDTEPTSKTQQLKEEIEEAVTSLSVKDTTVSAEFLQIDEKKGGLVVFSIGSDRLAVAEAGGKVVIFSENEKNGLLYQADNFRKLPLSHE